ncbi:MAG: DUF3108 domain-containing protein [Thermotogae bacterium]|nr:DUF3108 domain-containing protein [Thermotogota bacterium]
MIQLVVLFLSRPETLVYEAKFGPFKAGKLYLISSGRTTWKGKPVYRFKLIATGGVPFFRINDTILSITDTNLRPLLYKKVQHEGNYHFWGWIAYDHYNGEALYSDGQRMRIEPGSLDPLSLVYVVRLMDFDSSKEYVFPYHVDYVSERVKVKLVSKERVKTPLGTYDCWVVKPIMRSGRNVFGGKGGMRIWIDRKTRLPVKVEAKMIFGNAVGTLIKVK